jgi:hypothetical protein
VTQASAELAREAPALLPQAPLTPVERIAVLFEELFARDPELVTELLGELSRVDTSTSAKLFGPYHSPPTRHRSSNRLLMSPSPLGGRCGRIRRMPRGQLGAARAGLGRDFRQPEPPDVRKQREREGRVARAPLPQKEPTFETTPGV